MTPKNQRSWDSAGLSDETTGELHRSLPTGTWLAPEQIVLDRGGLAWLLRPNRRKTPGPGLLRQFAGLAGASDEEIFRFASRWGVLELCTHGLPALHSWEATIPPPSRKRLCHPRTIKRGRTSWLWEPLGAWRSWAHTAEAILNTAAALKLNARPDEEDVEWLSAGTSHLAETVLATAQQMGVIDQRIEPEVPLPMYISLEVNSWLSFACTRPRLFMEKDRWNIELSNTGLFGALGLELLFVVAAAEGLAICSACGVPYPRKRKPQSGRRNFCPRCGRKAADRLAHRTLREKQRQARLKLKNRHATTRLRTKKRPKRHD